MVSFREMAAHFECSRARVKQAMLSLARSGLITPVPGPRGLRMPTEAEEALRKLKERGWVVMVCAQPFERELLSERILMVMWLRWPCGTRWARKFSKPMTEVNLSKSGGI